MDDADRDELARMLNETVKRLAVRLDAMDEGIRKARIANVILTAALAQTILFQAVRAANPHDGINELLRAAQAGADAVQKNLEVHPADIEGAEDAINLLRSITDTGLEVLTEHRRWWRPWTWRW